MRKGRHKAGLTNGNCFAYVLAKAVGEPLLFKISDFARTVIPPANRSGTRRHFVGNSPHRLFRLDPFGAAVSCSTKHCRCSG
ncbi:hypothetical protein [Methylobacterium oryzisoli]|uniref:hypothetical protein n=1 Tax=Methylobacterium oryzisoli TaxID=3385502 RepID=UPI00389291BD